jgi:hypothetical protein
LSAHRLRPGQQALVADLLDGQGVRAFLGAYKDQRRGFADTLGTVSTRTRWVSVQAQRLGAAVLSPTASTIVSAGNAVGNAVSDAWHDLTPW